MTMDQARIEYVQCMSPSGLHRMAYKEWGDAHNPNVLLCIHGVTRVSDDFDVLAKEMSAYYRVVCPDVVGRGRSDWLQSAEGYQVPQYISDMVTLLARVNGTNISCVGTSMGGLIGMGLASMGNSPIKKLVLNDVGPVLNLDALQRINHHISQEPRYATFEEGAQYIRSISEMFGPHSDEQWRKLSQDVLRQDKDGMWIRHYDMKLAASMSAIKPEMAGALEAMMWGAYDKITCPTLLLRGAESDLLSIDTAKQMTQRGPKPKLVEFEKVGHVPTLVQPDQIAVVKEFLLAK